MITSISWKNVWRSKSRSMVVIVAVTLGTVAGLFVAGLMDGWLAQRINDVLFTETGHIKIQNPAYLINEETSYSLDDYSNIEQTLDTSEMVEAWAARSKIVAMATTARGNAGITLKGIDPDKEKIISNVYQKIVPNSGTYFETKSKLPQVVISNKTAELLKIKNFRITDIVIDSLKEMEIPVALVNKLNPLVKKRFVTQKKFEKAIKELWTEDEINSYAPALMNLAVYYQRRAKITFSFTKANGNLGYQTYQLCGVFKTSNTAFDQSSAFVRHADLVSESGLKSDQYHEVSILLKNEEDMAAYKSILQAAFPKASVMTWKELVPDAGMMADFMTTYYYIIMGIIFFALAFGIINTMLMSILERVKELGMLMAIGMKKIKVFSMIMLETVFLTLTGSTIGMLLGWILLQITGKTGLNFSSVAEGFESMGWAAVVYPQIDISFFFGIIVLVIIISILSSIIPARKALKMKPIEALRME